MKRFYSVICAIGMGMGVFSLTAISQSVGVKETETCLREREFIAITNSICVARKTQQQFGPPEGLFDDLRISIDLLNSISTSKVEVVCILNSGQGPLFLSFWITEDEVLRIRRVGKLQIYDDLTAFRMLRTETVNAHLQRFKSVDRTMKYRGKVYDAATGYYIWRMPDGQFECLFLRWLIDTRNEPPEMPAFLSLLRELNALTQKMIESSSEYDAATFER